MMYNLALTEKISKSSDCWQNLIRKKTVTMSIEELIHKYQGFEGELHAFYSLNQITSELNDLIRKCLEIKRKSNYLLLHIISNDLEIPVNFRENVKFVGYDIGICDEDSTIYSSIFNEILFGVMDELIAFSDLLNENLLFPDKFLAEQYIYKHNQLSNKQNDVEDYKDMKIYEIWKQNN